MAGSSVLLLERMPRGAGHVPHHVYDGCKMRGDLRAISVAVPSD